MVKHRTMWCASALALAAALAANSAEAAEAAEGARGPIQLGEIVVTAQKQSQSLSRVAGAVSAVAGDDLRAGGVSDVRNLSAAITGVMINTNGTVLSPSIRGIGSTQYSPLGGPAVGMNLDGVPIDGMVGPNGAFYDLERVEVLKGPQGTLYGRNATAGVINVISKRPVLGETSGSIQAEVGNYSSRRVEGGVNLPISSVLAARFSGLYSAHDGYMSNGYNDADDYALRAQLLFAPSDKASVLLGADYYHQGGIGVADIPLPKGSRGTNASDPYQQQYYPNPTDADQDNTMWGVHAEATFDLGIGELVLLPSYRELERQQVSYQGSFRAGVHDRDKQSSLEARLSNENGPFKWIVGGYVFTDEHRYDADYVNPVSCAGFTLARYQDGDCLTINGQRSNLPADSAAAFGQLTYNVSERLRLTGGLRYTRDTRSTDPNLDYTLYPFPGGPPVLMGSAIPAPAAPSLSNPLVGIVSDSTTGKFRNLSYKAGIEYDVAANTLLYANVSSGYKSGGVNDGNGTTYAPEKLLAYEAGVRTTLFDNTMRLHFNAFYWDYRDHQEGGVYFVPPVGILYQITNIPKGKIYGADLDLQWAPTQSDTVGAQVSWLESDTGPFALPTGVASASGHPFVNSPKWTLNLSYGHRFALGEWGLEPQIQTHIVSDYNTDFRFDPVTAQKGYHKSDFNLTLTAPNDRWRLAAFVRNIEDEIVVVSSQAAPGAGAPQYWGFLGDPRTYGVRFGANF